MSEFGKVCWNELNTRDLQKARTYYADVFGWTYDAIPMGDTEYLVAKQGDEMVGGLFDMNSDPSLDGLPAHWFTYFAVEDIDAMVKKAVEAGGSVKREPFEVPGDMKIAIIIDATGGVFGYMQNM